jgi:uroporphyrinogen decarboxylase
MEPILNLNLSERAGWVCGLGHGILKTTPEENVSYFIKTIRENFK